WTKLAFPCSVLVTMPTYAELEDRLTALGREIDNYLEDRFEGLYPLHPNRMPRGTGANPAYDGLSATTVAFSTGYGTKTGRGYVVNIDVRTLSWVTMDEKKRIYDEAYAFLQRVLPERFPERKLMVVMDGNMMKIIGDFSISSDSPSSR
ncbi:MAG: hypothetical protein KBS81_03315, partial [Spirochaetales bacterium]|nr:hypothetical protein [Candidatus Physcosoma equi]